MIILDCRFALIAKILIAKSSIAKVPIAGCRIAECPIAKCPIAKIPIAECPIAKIPIAKCPIAEIPLAECPIAEIPIAECPIAKCLIAQLQSNRRFTIEECIVEVKAKYPKANGITVSNPCETKCGCFAEFNMNRWSTQGLVL